MSPEPVKPVEPVEEKTMYNLYGWLPTSTPVTKESELTALQKECDEKRREIEEKYIPAAAAGGGRRRRKTSRKSPSKKRATKSMYSKIKKWFK